MREIYEVIYEALMESHTANTAEKILRHVGLRQKRLERQPMVYSAVSAPYRQPYENAGQSKQHPGDKDIKSVLRWC